MDLEVGRKKEAVEPEQCGKISPALTQCLHGDGERRLLGNLFWRQLLSSAVQVNGVEGKGKGRMQTSGLSAVRTANLSRCQPQEKGQT